MLSDASFCDMPSFNPAMNFSRDASMQQQENEQYSRAKNAAINYLARREHSKLELQRKLAAKGFTQSLINRAIDAMKVLGYQSDERFTEMFIRSKVASGNGPFKIKIALREKGICDSLVLIMMDKLNIDWYELVKKVKLKRFPSEKGADLNQLAKQERYLKNKGFYQDHIRAVVKFPD